MTKLSKKLRNQITNLAVDYAHFNRALHEGDSVGIEQWGRMLLNSQAELGVDLVDVENVRNLIRNERELRTDGRIIGMPL